jgi:ribosomal protein L29
MKEIREMSLADRQKRLNELRTELAKQRTMVKAGGSIENPSRIREIKKRIARILTVINEERRGEKKK